MLSTNYSGGKNISLQTTTAIKNCVSALDKTSGGRVVKGRRGDGISWQVLLSFYSITPSHCLLHIFCGSPDF